MTSLCPEILALAAALVYPQPPDDNHLRLTKEVISFFASFLEDARQTVLDVGCGQGIAKPVWESYGWEWTGVTLSECDCAVLARKGWHYYRLDMHDIANCRYGLVYARHVLEHSPLPALALQAWRKVCQWMIVIVPAPTPEAYGHRGHVSVFPMETWLALFRLLKLNVVSHAEAPYNNPTGPSEGAEYRFLLKGDLE